MKLSKIEQNALNRAYWAARLTSPAGTRPGPGVYERLAKRGLLEWRNGWRLTSKGEASYVPPMADPKAGRS